MSHHPTTEWSETGRALLASELRGLIAAADRAASRLERGVDATDRVESMAVVAERFARLYGRGTPCPCPECQSARFVTEATASLDGAA